MTTLSLPTLSRTNLPAVEWGLKANSQVFTSPLNGSVQTMELPGARWTARFSYTDRNEADSALLQAFAVQLRGQANRLAVYPFHRSRPRGTISLSGVTVSGAVAQLANTVTLAGCGANATLKAGDYFAVAGQLVMATADATANGSGVMSGVTFEPPVRAATGWADAAAVTLDKPTATFILQDPHFKWTAKPGVFTDFEFDLVEVFA